MSSFFAKTEVTCAFPSLMALCRLSHAPHWTRNRALATLYPAPAPDCLKVINCCGETLAFLHSAWLASLHSLTFLTPSTPFGAFLLAVPFLSPSRNFSCLWVCQTSLTLRSCCSDLARFEAEQSRPISTLKHPVLVYWGLKSHHTQAPQSHGPSAPSARSNCSATWWAGYPALANDPKNLTPIQALACVPSQAPVPVRLGRWRTWIGTKNAWQWPELCWASLAL